LGLIAGLCSGLLSLTPWLTRLEDGIGLSWLFLLRGERDPGNVVVVAMDRASVDQLDLDADYQHWPRDLHARLLQRLKQADVGLVVFDIFFERTRDADGDRRFAAAIRDFGKVLLFADLEHRVEHRGSTLLVTESEIPPHPLFASQAVCNAPFVVPDRPGAVTDYWAFKPGAAGTVSLPVCAFHLHLLLHRPDAFAALRRLDERLLHLPEHAGALAPGMLNRIVRDIREVLASDRASSARLLAEAGDEPLLRAFVQLHTGPALQAINYYGPPQSIPTLPFWTLLEMSDDELAALRGKAVFVGVSEDAKWAQLDTVPSAFVQDQISYRIGGVEVCATIFSNLLGNELIKRSSAIARFTLHALLGFAAALLGRMLSPLPALAAGTLLAGGFGAVAVQLFSCCHLALPLLTPLAAALAPSLTAGLLLGHQATVAEKRRLTQAFGRYLPAHKLAQLIKPIVGAPSTERVSGICLLSDIENYTGLSERLDPEHLNQLINEFFATVFVEVERRDGQVSQVIGDSVLALWIDRGSARQHCTRSCQAALALLAAVDAYNHSHPEVRIPLRVGLNYGEFVMADLSTHTHSDYRPVGDMINTASRLEAANKHLGTYLIVSEPIAHGAEGLVFRELGLFRVTNRRNPLRLYAPLGAAHDLEPEYADLIDAYDKALRLFRARRWQAASAAFRTILERWPEDGPSKFHLQYSLRHQETPPADSWDGSLYLAK
jgi:adenylate cyclase